MLATPPILLATPADGPSAADAEVLAELTRLRTKPSGLGNTVILLAISLALFVGLGSWRWSWRLTLLLVPILLFHELGHLAAMRLFGYRNLRMLFIPLLGAAVIGRQHDVAGWKKVVVSLAGPVPGIVLGAVLTFTVDSPLVREAALLMLVINGLNLLPILPLDGGWVAHVLLFSRHRFADFAFRLAAAVALLAAAVLTDDRILLFLAIPTLMSLPMTFKTGRIADELKRDGASTALADDEVVPVPTALAAIAKVRASMGTAKVTSKTLATVTDQVLEAVGARPPRLLPSLALGALHALFLVIALAALAGGVLRGAFHPQLVEMQPLPCDTVAEEPPPEAAGATLVALTFDDIAAAIDGTAAVAGRLDTPPWRFGALVLGRIAGTGTGDPPIEVLAEWFEQPIGRAQTQVIRERTFQIHFDCALADPARRAALAAEVGAYFAIVDPQLRTPWSARHPPTADQHHARRTLSAVLTGLEEIWLESKLDVEFGTPSAAGGTDDDDPARRQQLVEDLRQRGEELDPNVVELLAKRLASEPLQPSAAEVDREQDRLADPTWWRQELGDRLGLRPGHDLLSTADDGAIQGSAYDDEAEAKLSLLVTPARAEIALPAISRWLCDQGCAVSYAVTGGATSIAVLEWQQGVVAESSPASEPLGQ